MKPERNKIYFGNALEILKTFDSKSIDMVVSSPPYFGPRDYESPLIVYDGKSDHDHQWTSYIQKGVSGGTKSKKVHVKGKDNFQVTKDKTYYYCKECGAWKGDLGHEPTSYLFVKHLCDIYDECYRVLKDEGTNWVNLSDSHYSYQSAKNTLDIHNLGNFNIGEEIKYKDGSLRLIPYLFCIEMTKRGWICRADNIWNKPDPMPHPVKNRCTSSHEFFFHFTKMSNGYYYKQQIEPLTYPKRIGNKFGGEKYRFNTYSGKEYDATKLAGRNKRDVWTVADEDWIEDMFRLFLKSIKWYKSDVWAVPKGNGIKEEHFAPYPRNLVKIPIEAGCPTKICTKCGKPQQYIIETTDEEDLDWKKACGADEDGEYCGEAMKDYDGSGAQDPSDMKRRILSGLNIKRAYWEKCKCNAPFINGLVLDPFMGSGTTALEAKFQGKDYVGIDLSEKYVKIAEERLTNLNQRRIAL